jgi:hypothetical protein
VAVELLLLGRLLLGRQLAGVAAFPLRVTDRLEDDELGAEGFGLLLGLGPDVVRLDHRAEPAGGADRLEPRDADTQDQHVRGLGGAGGGRQEREVAPERVRRDQHRLVAANVCLRAEGVHRLGPAERPRDCVEADRGYSLLCERHGGLRVDQRLEEADDDLAAAHDRDLVRRRLLDPQDRVRLGVELHRRDDRRAGVGVGLVRDERAGAGTGLDEDLEPGGRELAERLGYQGDAPLSGRGLLGDTDLHGHHLILGLGRDAGTSRARIPAAQPGRRSVLVAIRWRGRGRRRAHATGRTRRRCHRAGTSRPGSATEIRAPVVHAARRTGDQQKETAMLMTILGILVVLWLIGLVANIGGGLIHLLLVVAVIVFLANMFSSRRSV